MTGWLEVREVQVRTVPVHGVPVRTTVSQCKKRTIIQLDGTLEQSPRRLGTNRADNRKADIELLLLETYYFLNKYIFHYKYVASAVIYFESGWRIPKRYGYGKKCDAHHHAHHAAKRTYVLCKFTVKSSSEVLLGWSWWWSEELWSASFRIIYNYNIKMKGMDQLRSDGSGSNG